MNTWIPIVRTKAEYAQIKELIDRIYRNINDNFFTRNGFSVYFEAGGLCLFLSIYEKVFMANNQLNNSLLNHRLEFLIDNLNEYKPNDISDITRYAELGTLIAFLHNENLIQCDLEEICGEIDKTLIQFVPILAEEKTFDLMGGIISIGLYYYQRFIGAPGLFSNELNSVIEVLYDYAIKENENISWLSIVDFDQKTIGYNFGIAHGIPGILLFLRKMYEMKISTEKCKELIRGGIAFLESHMHFSGENTSVFFDVCDLKYKGEDSRLSWCYGDLGIAYAFILFSITDGLECERLQETALRILEVTSKRITFKQTCVSDAGLCHGCLGIAHIYNRLYQITRWRFLLDMVKYWYNKGVLMSNNSSLDYEGFWLPYFDKDDIQENIDDYNLSFQTGISGIALALISIIEFFEPTWDCFLLLS